MTSSVFRLFLVLGISLLGSACGGDGPQLVASGVHTENGVSVDVEVSLDADGVGLVEATYTPEPGWHLYSVDLADDGVDGIGRPTRLDVVGASAPEPLAVSVEPYLLRVDALDITVPVYPDGPVTLTMAVADADGPLEVAVSYMACSDDGGCKIPVLERGIDLNWL